jgi:DNA-binding NtrC family response regulator
VRELRNVIERICILSEGRFFSEKETMAALTPPQGAPPRAPFEAPSEKDEKKGDIHLLADAERDHITRVLKGTAGNKKAAAERLGVSRRALYRKLDRLGLR